MRRVYLILAILALMAARAGPASADVVWVDGPTQSIIGITGFQTFGNQMAGMTVDAYFQGGRVDNLVWQNLGGNLGGVVAADWSLQVNGDTFNDNAWSLTFNNAPRLLFLSLDSFAGNVVFDTLDVIDAPPDTPGSALGKAVYPQPPVTATYYGITGIIGDASSPYGDLYRWLEISFNPSSAQGNLTWSADTDSIGLPGGPQVPVPPTVLLLGSGLLGLVGWRRFRKG